MQKKKHCLVWANRLLVAVLTAALLLPLTMHMTPDAQAVTQAEINNLKGEASELKAEMKELEKELASINSEKASAMKQKQLLEQQINVAQAQIENLAQQVTKYDELLALKQAELEENQAEEARQYELFCQRVRAMEEEGQVNYWAILFNATSFSDLLDRLIMVDEIMAYDNAVMESLQTIRQQVEADIAEMEEVKSGISDAIAEQEQIKAALETRQAEVNKLISKINAEQQEVEDAVAELEAMANSMDAEIAKKQAELKKELEAQGSTITSEKGYLWPLPGITNLSSLYAGRIDPFTGKKATHSGIDVPASTGTKVLAAKSGVVITSGYNKGGYGNYVVISHSSDGDTTLYAHLSARKVKVGQVVKQGDVIGLVGSTGRSTGPHLHYEIRENNVRIDPVTRYNGLTYKGKELD